MITDIDFKSKISELDREKLPKYWNEYFEYENDIELSNFTKKEFIKEILEEKKKEKSFIDSQVLISKLLTKFGSDNNFHRKFLEKHSNSNSSQILGMQLYHIIILDNDIWTYCDLKRNGHLFSHATYFK